MKLKIFPLIHFIVSCVFRSTGLFRSDAIINKVKIATKICHAWDHCKYFDAANLPGVPSHIVTYVNQQKLEGHIDLKFNEYSTMLKSELDKRQMGGNMTMELIQDTITGPLNVQLEALNNSINAIKTQGILNPEGEAQPPGMGTFWIWSSDNKTVPRMLPENFKLNPAISPPLVWQQWHHGLTMPDGKDIGPLKGIEPKHCPEKHRRMYKRMKRFCIVLDTATNMDQSESAGKLALTFDQNQSILREKGILLPPQTVVGRKRTRNENGWNNIADRYER
jgi:hypothetical protein